MRMVDDNGLL